MFTVIVVVAVTLMQSYVFWRAASVPIVRMHVPLKVLVGLGGLIWTVCLLGALPESEVTGPLATALEFSSMTWLGVLFLMTVALLAVEAATGFGLLYPKMAPRLRGAALAVGWTLAILALVQGLRAPVVQSHEVYSPRLPAALDGTVIVVMSDLHLGSMLGTAWLAARAEQVRAEHPDAIVLIGDVFEGHGPPAAPWRAILSGMASPLGTWGVTGNHEMHSGARANDALFDNAGVHLLRNGWVELRPGLVLAGVENLPSGPGRRMNGDAVAAALAGRPPGATILLTHAPPAPDVVAGSGVDLMLSGHTHGGQLWPFGYLVRHWFPLFEGRYQVGPTTVIVSRGTGTWGPRMRLWRPAEIIRVTLRSGAEANASTVDTHELK
ncbi:MAG TPA: metallophosphoesterase [Albitalea sp.]|nr:metallophosphoesterase [Albitalea sp.]